MSYNRSAVAYWVAQYNASQATLTTRTTERDSARNSLYVSGTYLSGPTWQAQDAADLPRNPQLTTTLSTNGSSYTVPVSGQWVLITHGLVGTGTYSFNLTIAGSSGANGAVAAGTPNIGGANSDVGNYWSGFISAGATVTLNNATNPISGYLFFIPTTTYPH